MAMETKKTFCRFCTSCCAMEIDLEDGKPVALRADPTDPMSGGYSCLRGRELLTMHSHPDRVRGALKRQDGAFVQIPMHQALDEIAAKTEALIARYGARSIASYRGSWSFGNFPTMPISSLFHRAIGSPSLFSPITLDQPAKMFMGHRFGRWGGGLHSFKDADVILLIGNNPVLSHYTAAGGLPPFNPSRRLQDAMNRGLKLIVIDPRRTEMAQRATLHLQPRPGEDPTLLAGIARLILEENLYDQEFCDAFVDDLAGLKAALAPFTLQYVSGRAGVPREAIEAAARLFGGRKKGAASTGTGPEMAPRGSLTEHFVMTLNAICGRFYRAGEAQAVAPVLQPPYPTKAQVEFPPPAWGEGFHPTRFRGLTQIGEELPCNVLADEILTPGDGQIRALFSVGGNPMVAFPNQMKMKRALDDLELLVQIDPWMSATAKRAHYVLGPKMYLERDDATLLGELWFEDPYSNYTPAVFEADSDVIEEWEFYWEMAQRMGLQLTLNGTDLMRNRRPSKYEVMEAMTRGSRIPISRVYEDTAGKGGVIYEEVRGVVAPKDPDNTNRFRLLPDGVREEIAEVAAEPLGADGQALPDDPQYTHLLISRRIKQFFNSTGHNVPNLRKKGTTNYAYMHTGDLAVLEIPSETMVEITSETGRIVGVVKASDDVRPGCISMAHAFGDADSDESNVLAQGASTNRLVADDRHYDKITGQARQSAIPVKIRMI